MPALVVQGDGIDRLAVMGDPGGAQQSPTSTLPHAARGRGSEGHSLPRPKDGGGLGWGCQVPEDMFDHGIRVAQNLVVRDAQDAPPQLGQGGIALCIPNAFGMLPAIHLDHQLRLDTGEVGDMGRSMLSAKVEAAELTAAQPLP